MFNIQSSKNFFIFFQDSERTYSDKTTAGNTYATYTWTKFFK